MKTNTYFSKLTHMAQNPAKGKDLPDTLLSLLLISSAHTQFYFEHVHRLLRPALHSGSSHVCQL